MNTNTDKYWKWALIGLVIYNLIALCQYLPSCESKNSEKTSESRKAEQARTATITTNTAEHAKYNDRDKLLARIKALRSDSLATAKGKDKQASEKARQSALKYADSGKAEDCKDALTDCQEECETKGYSLAAQERMLLGFESSDSLHRSEIDRQVAVIDTLNRGWKKANVVNGKLEKKIERKNTRLKIGAGIIAVLGVLVAAR